MEDLEGLEGDLEASRAEEEEGTADSSRTLAVLRSVSLPLRSVTACARPLPFSFLLIWHLFGLRPSAQGGYGGQQGPPPHHQKESLLHKIEDKFTHHNRH